MTAVIPGPGIYQLTADEYHADPIPGGSLSSSGARKLLPPGCPALFKYEREHGQPPKKEFDFGHAAHRMVLGAGAELVVVDAADWRTNAAKDEARKARARGAVPLLPHDYDRVKAMATALRQHRGAGPLLDPEAGKPEQGLFWMDPSGIVRRALVDWLPNRRPGRMVFADYKTCRAADRDSIQRSVYENGYHQQAAWYSDGITALGLADEPAMVFIFQEKTPPYLVTVVELDVVALKIGRSLNRRAIELFKTCRETGYWPPYSDGIELIPLPAWAEARHAEDIAS